MGLTEFGEDLDVALVLRGEFEGDFITRSPLIED